MKTFFLTIKIFLVFFSLMKGICMLSVLPMNMDIMYRCNHVEQVIIDGGKKIIDPQIEKTNIKNDSTNLWIRFSNEKMYFYRLKPIYGTLRKVEIPPQSEQIYEWVNFPLQATELQSKSSKWLSVSCNDLGQHWYFVGSILLNTAVLLFIFYFRSSIFNFQYGLKGLIYIGILSYMLSVDLPSFITLGNALKSTNWNKSDIISDPTIIEQKCQIMSNTNTVFYGDKNIFSYRFYIVDLGHAEYCYYFPEKINVIHHSCFEQMSQVSPNLFFIKYRRYMANVYISLFIKLSYICVFVVGILKCFVRYLGHDEVCKS